MRLIDADELRFEIAKYFDGLPIQVHYDMLKMVDEAPIIEAEPIKRGKWTLKHDSYTFAVGPAYWYECSNCGGIAYVEHPYCPRCGAKIEGEE